MPTEEFTPGSRPAVEETQPSDGAPAPEGGSALAAETPYSTTTDAAPAFTPASPDGADPEAIPDSEPVATTPGSASGTGASPAEAAATAAKGAAEAGATKAMAEAMELYGEAAKAKQALDILPDVVRAYAEPMSAIDGLTVVSTDGAGKVTQMGASVLPQVDALVKTFLGKSVSELVTGQAQDEAGSDVA